MEHGSIDIPTGVGLFGEIGMGYKIFLVLGVSGCICILALQHKKTAQQCRFFMYHDLDSL
ncbi:MAG: hypothetical protein LBE38_10605 [Deltaproteobacteria bacterium]|nr:hypothetical protein [Deltaproteobacteria bacterium]